MDRFDEDLCLATSQDDPQFSSFVYWDVQSLVYAEEHQVVQQISNEMPLVHAFGSDFQRMFRNAIHAVGNYEEVYERHLDSILPRQGRNVLNLLEDNSPMRYLPPGFPL